MNGILGHGPKVQNQLTGEEAGSKINPIHPSSRQGLKGHRVDFSVEPLSIPEIKLLLSAYHAETGDGDPLNPDFEMYGAGESTGLTRFIAARDKGVLTGFAIFLVNANHHSGAFRAVHDVLFLLPQYRGFWSGKFLQYCADYLQMVGCEYVDWNANPVNAFGRLLHKRGAHKVSEVYRQPLKKGA